jgi:Lipoprotein LpqB beta-propeller domain/Sporulation and spore germination
VKRLLALALVFTLTGCASLPVAGPVRIGPDLVQTTDGDSFYYSPSSPFDGASQTEILNGFIAAGTGPQNDYAVAREYLSESIRSSWNPNQEVLIQRSSPQVVISDQDTAELVVDVAATVDADGKYLVTPLGTGRVLEFSFVQENSQWRLSAVPDATVLIRPVFDVVFSGYSVFFLDRQKRFLVPELRWFPTTPATGTRLANALLGGASNWLKPAVVSAIPTGTRLSIDAVTVENGVALVDLTARALVASRADRSLMKSQLEATLSQLPNVSEVAISIERAMQEIVDTDSETSESGVRSLAVVGEEGLELLASSQDSTFEAGKNFFEQLELTEVALSGQSGWIVTLTGSGVFRTKGDRPGAEVELIDSRAAIADIEFDRQEYLWSTSRAIGSEIIATSPSLEQSFVSAPWLEGLSVRAFAIAPGGSKIALLVQGPSQTRVLVSAVVRNLSGTPIELAEPLEVAGELSNPTSVSWVDQITIATVNTASGSTSALLSNIGGTSRQLPALPGTRKIIAAGASSQLYLLTETGELFSYRGSAWTPLRQSIRALALVN